MRPIKVLIVDDMVVARRMIAEALTDPALEVVGSAPNGAIALAKIPQLNPDIVVLDIEMPEMDGLATLAEIRKKWPRLPVIMFSSLTKRGAVVTLEALTLGANDYVTKPDQVGSPQLALQHIRDGLIPKIKIFCQDLVQRGALSPLKEEKERLVPKGQFVKKIKELPGQVDIVAIGVSTGGPTALAGIFSKLPANFPVPIVMVQHMPPIFTKILAEHLSSKSAILVEEGAYGVRLQPGKAWLAPGEYHMVVRQVTDGVAIGINQDAPNCSCRPSVNVLFESVANVYGERTLAVILTGMGEDGLEGCKLIHKTGGRILAQDQETSVVWGMPGVVAKANIADAILPLDEIPNAIVEIVNKDRDAMSGDKDSAARAAN